MRAAESARAGHCMCGTQCSSAAVCGSAVVWQCERQCVRQCVVVHVAAFVCFCFNLYLVEYILVIELGESRIKICFELNYVIVCFLIDPFNYVVN